MNFYYIFVYSCTVDDVIQIYIEFVNKQNFDIHNQYVQKNNDIRKYDIRMISENMKQKKNDNENS